MKEMWAEPGQFGDKSAYAMTEQVKQVLTYCHRVKLKVQSVTDPADIPFISS